MKKSQREDVERHEPQRNCEVVYGKNIAQDPWGRGAAEASPSGTCQAPELAALACIYDLCRWSPEQV